MNYNIVYSDLLYHHGILGQKWGVRRYQNPDGTLTDAGRRRLQEKEFKVAKKSQGIGYRDSWSRATDYLKKSKVISERSKELKNLEVKVKNLDSQLDNLMYEKSYDDAVKDATAEIIKDHPDFMKDPEYDVQDFIDFCLYEEGYLNKHMDKVNKNNPEYKSLKKELKNAVKEYKDTCKNITEEIIGEYGNQKISGLGTDMTYKELVYYALNQPRTMYMFTYIEEMGRDVL